MEGQPTIFLAGDSTVRDYDESQFPQAGWGQFLGNYLKENIAIKNYAVGGLSSKTFITEGYLSQIDAAIKESDFLFIQFGHNDSTPDRVERYTEPFGDYKTYLKEYIDVAKMKKAIPILFTPVARLNYKEGKFLPNFMAYCEAMKEIAVENDVLLIDLMALGVDYLSTIGYPQAEELYMIAVNGTDCTHFTEKGADAMAQIVCEQLKNSQNDIAQFMKEA